MVHDGLLSLQDSVTKTASFNSTAISTPTTTSLLSEDIFAEIFYSAASNASGSNTVTFSIEHSDDNSTFYAHTSGAADAISLSTTAKVGRLFLPCSSNKPYIRLVCTIAGAGSTPTITYNAFLGVNRP
jgi:hypothetical protein